MLNYIHVCGFVSIFICSLKMEARWVWDCAFTSDSKYLFTASGCQLRLWNLGTEEVILILLLLLILEVQGVGNFANLCVKWQIKIASC